MTDDITSLSLDELWTRHAKTLAAYSEARAQIDGHEYMPWIQTELATLNRELERRGITPASDT